jgi:hypothetical protein
MPRSLSTPTALITGLLLVLLAGLIAEVALGGRGHRIRFDQLPSEAQKIAIEQHPNPVSPQQWKRMNEVMKRHGGWPSGRDMVHVTVRKAWLLFVLLPAGVLLLMRWKGVALRPANSVALLAPSAAVLLWAWLTPVGPLIAG